MPWIFSCFYFYWHYDCISVMRTLGFVGIAGGPALAGIAIRIALAAVEYHTISK
jgi:hypothetical protein